MSPRKGVFLQDRSALNEMGACPALLIAENARSASTTIATRGQKCFVLGKQDNSFELILLIANFASVLGLLLMENLS